MFLHYHCLTPFTTYLVEEGYIGFTVCLPIRLSVSLLVKRFMSTLTSFTILFAKISFFGMEIAPGEKVCHV